MLLGIYMFSSFRSKTFSPAFCEAWRDAPSSFGEARLPACIVSREMLRGDGEIEARRNNIRYPVGRTIYTDRQTARPSCKTRWARSRSPNYVKYSSAKQVGHYRCIRCIIVSTPDVVSLLCPCYFLDHA